MMAYRYIITVLVLVFCISACSDNSTEIETPSGTEGVIPEYQLKALQKAQQVEDLLDKAEKERRKSLQDY